MRFHHSLLLIMSLTIFSAAQAAPPKQERNCMSVDTKGKCAQYQLSIIELISNPDKYDGKNVQLIGFLHLEIEGDGMEIVRS
jgi:hypothetical protein